MLTLLNDWNGIEGISSRAAEIHAPVIGDSFSVVMNCARRTWADAIAWAGTFVNC